MRRTALQLLAADTRWRADPDTLDLQRNSAVADTFPAIREAAMRTVSASWRDDPAIATWLSDDAFEGNDPQAKLAVIHALTADWHDDPRQLNG